MQRVDLEVGGFFLDENFVLLFERWVVGYNGLEFFDVDQQEWGLGVVNGDDFVCEMFVYQKFFLGFVYFVKFGDVGVREMCQYQKQNFMWQYVLYFGIYYICFNNGSILGDYYCQNFIKKLLGLQGKLLVERL